MTIALYPGSFDPVTHGHLDIAIRAANLFEQLIIGVYSTPPKHLLFDTEERAELLKRSVAHLPNVQVRVYNGLTVEFAHQVGARVIIRGLRQSSDFEREFEMGMMNKNIAPDVELICLMTSIEYQFLSSTLLKEIAEFRGDVSSFVPEHVALALRKKFHP